MVAAPKLTIDAAILTNARRAAAKLRPKLSPKAGSTSVPLEVTTRARELVALLALVDVVSEGSPPAPRSTPDHDELTPNQAAEILKMSRPSVMRLIELGFLHPRMVHSRHKLARREVEAFAERQTRERREAMANLAALSEEHGF